jgi:DNA-binding Lrp family transcriptional regulator
MSLDPLDLKLLAVLQEDAALSNAELAQRIGLSPSQCSRRRAGLEQAGYIRAYCADSTAEEFAHFLEGLDEVQQAHSVAGDADYLLHLRVRSLDELAEFVHKRLLPHAHVAQVRSDIVLKTIKENRGFRIRAGATRKGRKTR